MACRHLVALSATDNVLEEQREPTGLRFDLGHIGGGDAGVDPRRHLTVEADLDLIGPQGQPGAPALVVGGGELADHRGGSGRAVTAGIGQGEARGVGHLAGADGFAGEVVDPDSRPHGAGLGQRVAQPFRRHVGRGVQQGDLAHGGTRLGPRGLPRCAPQAIAVAVGSVGGWRSAALRVPHRARASAQAA